METNIIYKVTNVVNDEVYIGATTNSLEERKKDHLRKTAKKVGSYFQEAIGTYGPEAFLWEQIDTATTTDELAQKEIKYIEEFGKTFGSTDQFRYPRVKHRISTQNTCTLSSYFISEWRNDA